MQFILKNHLNVSVSLNVSDSEDTSNFENELYLVNSFDCENQLVNVNGLDFENIFYLLAHYSV